MICEYCVNFLFNQEQNPYHMEQSLFEKWQSPSTEPFIIDTGTVYTDQVPF
jgi:hypothetical protein